MGIAELLLLAAALSMDAFTVAVCKGLALRSPRPRHFLIVGAWFGGFQALMPAIGYLLGSAFAEIMHRWSSWIAFGLLAVIGANMIREAVRGEENGSGASLAFGTMLLLALATSVDALAVGVTFAALEQPHIIWSVLLIGCVTFAVSALGVRIGSVFGTRYQKSSGIAGGVILILLGIRFLLEHFGLWFT